MERRYKKVFFNHKTFLRTLGEILAGKTVVKTPFPEGFKIIGLYEDPCRLGWYMGIYHPDFEVVPEGNEIPEYYTDSTIEVAGELYEMNNEEFNKMIEYVFDPNEHDKRLNVMKGVLHHGTIE